jgi:hypothetical protein
MSGRASRSSGRSRAGGGVATAEDRGVSDHDWLLVRDIVEDPGLPVLVDRVPLLMRARGSAVTDSAFETMLNPKVVRSSAMFDALDIELKCYGERTQWSELRRYLTWRGMPATGTAP